MGGLHCATCTCQPSAEELGDRPWKHRPIEHNQFNGKDYCPAEWRPKGDSPHACHLALGCTIEGHHDGPHEDYVLVPCVSCGAWDDHTQWCEVCEAEYAEWLRRKEAGEPHPPDRYVTMRFETDRPSDEPTYWAAPSYWVAP